MHLPKRDSASVRQASSTFTSTSRRLGSTSGLGSFVRRKWRNPSVRREWSRIIQPAAGDHNASGENRHCRCEQFFGHHSHDVPWSDKTQEEYRTRTPLHPFASACRATRHRFRPQYRQRWECRRELPYRMGLPGEHSTPLQALSPQSIRIAVRGIIGPRSLASAESAEVACSSSSAKSDLFGYSPSHSSANCPSGHQFPPDVGEPTSTASLPP